MYDFALGLLSLDRAKPGVGAPSRRDGRKMRDGLLSGGRSRSTENRFYRNRVGATGPRKAGSPWAGTRPAPTVALVPRSAGLPGSCRGTACRAPLGQGKPCPYSQQCGMLRGSGGFFPIGLQLLLQHFAHGVSGELINENDRLGLLITGQGLTAKRDDLIAFHASAG